MKTKVNQVVHLAFHDGRELKPVCGSTKNECWVMAKADATCEECLQDKN